MEDELLIYYFPAESEKFVAFHASLHKAIDWGRRARDNESLRLEIPGKASGTMWTNFPVSCRIAKSGMRRKEYVTEPPAA